MLELYSNLSRWVCKQAWNCFSTSHDCSLAFSVVLPFIAGSDNLQCSDDNYFVAFENPTEFCQFQGAYSCIADFISQLSIHMQ